MTERLTDWIGTREESEDLITGWPAAALQATLDFTDPPLQEGDELPPLWHWLYFLPTVPGSGLGSEGHARLGGLLPPVRLPRRMFAGGRTEFVTPVRIGERARRLGTVVSVEEKQGRSGALVFVTVRYEVSTEAGLALTEEQDLVYREAATRSETHPPGPDPIPSGTWTRTIAPNEVMLFRFSALTFNAHRIHYDYPYVTGKEGYPNLIVHGPLTALLLADLARRQGPGSLRGFSFRSRAPLFANGPFTLLGDPDERGPAHLSAWSHDRRLAMTAEADF
ncbi:MAG: MaoC family dehydratase N-terminal domain-containing protein [Acidimicrobiia bacterium]|nr:MaoC family dehydratase N-terminal domain-containing protein [Acidimicrobiia bacterium]